MDRTDEGCGTGLEGRDARARGTVGLRRQIGGGERKPVWMLRPMQDQQGVGHGAQSLAQRSGLLEHSGLRGGCGVLQPFPAGGEDRLRRGVDTAVGARTGADGTQELIGGPSVARWWGDRGRGQGGNDQPSHGGVGGQQLEHDVSTEAAADQVDLAQTHGVEEVAEGGGEFTERQDARALGLPESRQVRCERRSVLAECGQQCAVQRSGVTGGVQRQHGRGFLEAAPSRNGVMDVQLPKTALEVAAADARRGARQRR